MTYLTNNFPSPFTIKEDIVKEGFKIYPDVISSNHVNEMRDFWLSFFNENKPQKEVLRGDMSLGQENFNSFTDSDFWTLYRNFDFLWNEPTHKLTQDLSIELNKIRNLALGQPENYGLYYNPECYGFYTSTSYYPPNSGRLETHEDGYPVGFDKFALLHFMVPLTFKGIDHEKGGLTYHNKAGEKIDVDELMKPGSILFFDGAMKHGVDNIIPFIDKQSVGRLAFFAIPIIFHKKPVDSISTKLASKKSGRFSKYLSR